MSSSTNSGPPRPLSSLLTYAIVAGSAICFSSKGVMAKSAYQLGADAITVLGLRMLFATPVFLGTAWICLRRGPALTRQDYWQVLGLGFLGYYLSSVMNFIGLQYISAGLERIILYTYPVLVVMGGWAVGSSKPRLFTVGACLLAYGGIVLAYVGEAQLPQTDPTHVLLGAMLVFGSALTYATFILLSGPVVRRVGAARFTSLVSGTSGVMVILHLLATTPVSKIVGQPAGVYAWAVAIAVLGTIVPSYLLGIGLKRAGSQQFAIISCVGPLMTLVLAWLLLGEQVTVLQIVGFVLSVGGGLAVSLWKDKPRVRSLNSPQLSKPSP